jgi:hypothetical protein
LGDVVEISHKTIYVPYCIAIGQPHTEACDCAEYAQSFGSTLPPQFQQDEATLYSALRRLGGLARVRATVALENLVAEITEQNSGR